MKQEVMLNQVPTVSIRRSKFLQWGNHRSTMDTGLLTPVFSYPLIYPGDSIKLRFNIVLNQTTPMFPTMDNSWLSLRCFFVRNALLWNHWGEFNGENKTGAWKQTTEYTTPQIVFNKTSTAAKCNAGSLWNHMGMPITTNLPDTTDGIEIENLLGRGYCMIWNDFYRDQNVCPPMQFSLGDTTVNQGADTDSWFDFIDGQKWNNNEFPANLAPVFKYRDYYNGCLPEPQKSDPIEMPLGEFAPIIFENGATATYAQDSQPGLYNVTSKNRIGGVVNLAAVNGLLQNTTEPFSPGSEPVTFSAYANLQNAVSATVNAVRMAGAMERLMEKRARGGTRLPEINLQQWGVRSPDFLMCRPIYLGGKKIPITMNRVLQTSSTDSTSPQGHQSAYSVTIDSDFLFNYTFLDYGVLFVLADIRTEHSYSQGIPRMLTRKYYEDYYNPVFANLGEEAVKNKEIMLTNTSTDEEIFGYQERWAEMRSLPNLNTGLMATNAPLTLSNWHYGDLYSSLPVLSKEWRAETKAYVQRTLAVQNQPQYYFDSRVEIESSRPLPLWSIPGYFDHF